MATSVDAKLLKQTKFPPEFNQKVDMQKVNVEVMKKWIAGKISEILGSEDDVVIELCFNLLENSRFPDIKVLQIQLTGFLDKHTAKFCKELWTLCLSAQSNPQGVPKELLEAKKLELIQEKHDAEKAAEEARRRKEQDKQKDQSIDNIRQRERGDRGRGRGRGGRGGNDYDRRPPRDSRSPPPRRRGSLDRVDYRGPPQRRETDTYIPRGRGGRYSDDRRRRTPTVSRSPSRSRSRSVTPPRRRRDDREQPKTRHRYTPSRSPTPIRRGAGNGRLRRTPDRSDDRARSSIPSEASRSRSPRRRRSKRRSPSVSSRSRSPPPRRRRRVSSPSISRSRSRSLGRDHRRRAGRSKRSPSYASSDDDAMDTRADNRKGRRYNDHQYRRRSPSRSRSRDAVNRRAPPPPPRSRSPSPRRDRKRHRSIERYAPAARRRRNTSSDVSPPPPVEKRRRRSDVVEENSKHRRGEGHKSFKDKDPQEEVKYPPLTATELRERLLREKVKALRKPSASKTATKPISVDTT